MIVTFAIQQTIKPVSANNKVIFEQVSQETEDVYLPKYLGRAFAYDVQKNPGNYVDLLDGVEFDDCNGDTIKFKGLKYILAYFIFAEYSWQTKYRDTYTGFVNKNREEAVAISQGQQSNLKNHNRLQAESEVEVMKLYLNENLDTYDLWKCKTGKPYTPIYTNVKKVRS